MRNNWNDKLSFNMTYHLIFNMSNTVEKELLTIHEFKVQNGKYGIPERNY